jgi:YidC/Oxa1 family membrane protein insertase
MAMATGAEKRLLLALALMFLVVWGTSLLLPRPPQRPTAAPTSSAPASPSQAAPSRGPRAAAAQPAPTAVPIVRVETPLYRFAFSARGAALVEATLKRYPSYVRRGQPVQLILPGVLDVFAPVLFIDGRALDLRTVVFTVDSSGLRPRNPRTPRRLVFRAALADGAAVTVSYRFRPDDYTVDVEGQVTGVPAHAVRFSLGPGLLPNEHPAHRAERELGLVARRDDELVVRPLRKVHGVEIVPGPLVWAALKEKYFVVAAVAGDRPPFLRVTLRDLADTELVLPSDGGVQRLPVPRALVEVDVPVRQGHWRYTAYVGPQDYQRLAALGHHFEDLIPFGYRWMQPVIRPLAAAILWVLVALHRTFDVGYGVVLILFGLLVRVLLWPLNTRAMRAQMRNAAQQPILQARLREIQTKYRDDPRRQQEEMMRLYRELGFNPFSGCLPLLLPLPILITLYFVFQNTIEFRGARFLWLPDLSLPDPYFILPILLVASTFLLQWLSLRLTKTEITPQMRSTMLLMPLLLGVIFFSLPAGVNLYYLVTNLATIPQQVWLAKKREQWAPKVGAAAGSWAAPSTGGQRARKR